MSLRSFFKRLLPEPHRIRDHRHLRHFGDLLHDPNIWHLNRRSAAGGIAIGLFWITNPLTFAPIFYFAYQVGSWLLSKPVQNIAFELSFHWLQEIFVHIWQPLLLGCVILATLSALTGYIATSLLWRILLLRKWSDRKSRKP
jgi:uncharacterized protein (DUF2062 family)